MRVFDILKEQDPPEIPPRKNNVVKVDFTKGVKVDPVTRNIEVDGKTFDAKDAKKAAPLIAKKAQQATDDLGKAAHGVAKDLGKFTVKIGAATVLTYVSWANAIAIHVRDDSSRTDVVAAYAGAATQTGVTALRSTYIFIKYGYKGLKNISAVKNTITSSVKAMWGAKLVKNIKRGAKGISLASLMSSISTAGASLLVAIPSIATWIGTEILYYLGISAVVYLITQLFIPETEEVIKETTTKNPEVVDSFERLNSLLGSIESGTYVAPEKGVDGPMAGSSDTRVIPQTFTDSKTSDAEVVLEDLVARDILHEKGVVDFVKHMDKKRGRKTAQQVIQDLPISTAKKKQLAKKTIV